MVGVKANLKSKVSSAEIPQLDHMFFLLTPSVCIENRVLWTSFSFLFFHLNGYLSFMTSEQNLKLAMLIFGSKKG